MSKFWETKDFQSLHFEWELKLKESGFINIEDESGNLIRHNREIRNTVSFQNHKRISEFFFKLDGFLFKRKNLPPLHRKILELYSQGTHITGKNGITSQVDRCDRAVRYIITRYKKILLDQ